MNKILDILRDLDITKKRLSVESNVSISTINKATTGKITTNKSQNKITYGLNQIIDSLGFEPNLTRNQLFGNDKINLVKTKNRIFSENALEIFFIHEATIHSLQELSKTSSKWNKILHGFARVSNSNETDFRILSIEQGSIILTLAASAGTIVAIGAAINEILKIINNSLQIKKTSRDLKKMNNSNLNEAISELDKNSEINPKDQAIQITNLIINNYNSSDKHEVENALKYSCEKLIEFYDKGGEINLVLTKNEQSTNSDLLDQIKKASDLRKLNEQKLKEIVQDEIKNLTD